MQNNELWAVVNEEQQKTVLNLLKNFKTDKLFKNNDEKKYDYPLVINFDTKSIRRSTSNLACACAASQHLIKYEKDFSLVLKIIKEKTNDDTLTY